MTMPDPIVIADRALLNRVTQAAASSKTLSAAIHDAAGALGIALPWHEADVLAEAVSHHYDVELQTTFVVHRDTGLDWFRERHGAHMRRELVVGAAEQGYALVEEPVETVHVSEDVVRALQSEGRPMPPERRSPALTDEQVSQMVARYPFYMIVVALTGRFRKLAKAN